MRLDYFETVSVITVLIVSLIIRIQCVTLLSVMRLRVLAVFNDNFEKQKPSYVCLLQII